MNFKKRYTKMTILLALGQGVLLGIVAVAIVGFILLKTNPSERATGPDEEVPASGPVTSDSKDSEAKGEKDAKVSGSPIAMYAKQHAVFSSQDAAASFISDEQLPKAAVVQSDDQYFVWSALGPSANDADPAGETGVFRKEVTVSPLVCDGGEDELLRSVLHAQQISEIQDLATSKKNAKGSDEKDPFVEKVSAITAFTDDLNVIRIHILAHFSETWDCVKLDF